jgi:hypothetical protein
MSTETKPTIKADTWGRPADIAVPQRVAEQPYVEIIPGTEVMTDIGNSHLEKAGGNGSVYVDNRRTPLLSFIPLTLPSDSSPTHQRARTTH